MKVKLKITILITIILVGIVATNSNVFGADWWWLLGGDPRGGSQTSPQTSVLDEQDDAFISASGLSKKARPEIIVSEIIKIVLSFLGVIFVVLIIYAGISWMTSGGNEEKISKAKKILITATIGLAIILSAYAITFFIIDKLLEASGTSAVGLD